MALKDLVAQKSALTEEAIERIVKDYVRYDGDERDVVFTPEFGRLSNKNKILIYLVSVLGWPFVVEEVVPAEAKPSDIEAKLAIPGGTLRPILKDLKERHLISVKGGSYAVRAANLDAVNKEVHAQSNSSAPKTNTRKKPKSNQSKKATTSEQETKPSKKAGRGGSQDITAKFSQWIDSGFFNQPRTLSDVQSRFHQEALIIPQSSIPKYLLAAVRSERLDRTKQEVNGKQRWAYRTKTKS